MDTTNPHSHSKGNRRTLAVLAFILVGILILTMWEIVRTNHTMRADLLDDARLIAKSLNLNDIKTLTGTKQDLKKPEYQRLKEYFGALKASNSKYRFIYLMGKRNDDSVVFYVCNEPEGSLEEVLAGDVYKDIPQGFKQAFATGIAQIEGPYTDRWGKFVGVAIPMLYSIDQNAQVVLAVDTDAGQWNRKLAKAAIPPLILALALLLIYTLWLILTSRHKSIFDNNRWQYYIEPCLIAVIGITITLYIAWSMTESERHARHHAFNHVASTRTEAVIDAFDDLQKTELESLAKFLESREDITNDEFLNFTSFLTSNKAIQGWEWITAVKSENKIEFEQKARNAGLTNYNIWHKDENGFRQPAIGREVYYPIYLVTPGNTNEMARGFDIGSESVRHRGIEEAIRTRLSTCTEPVTLLQGEQDPKGLLILRPIYRQNNQNELRGFAMAVLRMSSFLKQIAPDNSSLIELSTLTRETPVQTVAVSWDKANTPQTELSISCPIYVLGRCYFVKVYSDQTFDILYPRRALRYSIIIGIILTVALVSIAGSIQHRRLELENLISERTAKLQASELLQKSLMESLPIGVAIIDPVTKKIESINPHVSVLFGAPANDLIGKKCHKLLCPADKDKCPIIDLNEEIDNSDREMMRADGSKIPVLKTVKKISLNGQEKLLECFVDVSEQKKTETELANAVNNLTMATKAGRVGIWSYDIAANKFTADNQLGRLYGFKDGQFDGKYNSWMSYIHPDDRQEYYNQFQMTLNDVKELNFEFRIIWANGVVRHIHSLAQLQKDTNGKPIAIIGTSLDITRTKNIELNLKETISKLEEANVRANQLAEMAEIANKTKSEFLANMSHEIRTPMNSILGFSDMLMEGELTEDQRDIVQTINRSGNSLLTLINDILDLSKIEAGKMNIENIDFDIWQMTNDICNIIRPKVKPETELICNIQENVPHWLKGDPHRMQQVLLNLLGNAAKFTEKGKIELTIECINCDDKDAMLEIAISDTGIGIPPEKQRQIYDAFNQGDGSTTRKYGGTGLGLTISKRILQLMDSDLLLESTVGKGSKFFFLVTLPLGTDQELKNNINQSNDNQIYDQQLSALPGRTVRVLIADDDDVNLKLTIKLLNKAGYETDTAHNGQEAIEKLQQQTFDVVLMDMQMPVMDGLEATRKIRELEIDIPIIALTANAFESDRKNCINAGMNDYLSKPLQRDKVINCINKWITVAHI